MVIRLGQGVAVAQPLQAAAVRVQDPPVGCRGLGLQPAHEGGAEIEADMLVIIDDVQNAALVVENAGATVGRIAFGVDALVPIVVRMSAALHFDLLDPGVFPGRLIEMAMDDHAALGAFRRQRCHAYSHNNLAFL